MIHLSRSRFTGLIAILTCVSGLLVTGLSETATNASAEGAATPNPAEHGAGAPAGGQAKAPEGVDAVNESKPIVRAAPRPKSGCLTDETALEGAARMKDELAEARKALEKKEAELAAREKALSEELAKIEAVRDEIQAASGVNSVKNEEKIAKLVETLEGMSPKAAAQVVSNIDETLAREAASRLSSPKLGKILAAMDVSKSARLTENLAGVARAKKPTASKSSSEEAPTPAKGAAEATTSANAGGVKGGEKNGNLKQSDSNNVANRQPEPALGREPASVERR